MHELALAEGILAVVLDVAAGEPVRRVCLQVGQLLRVVPESLQFSFDLVAEGTSAAGAVLEMAEVPGRWRCPHCAAEHAAALPPVACHRCGAGVVECVAGDALLVDAVELVHSGTIRRCPGP